MEYGKEEAMTLREEIELLCKNAGAAAAKLSLVSTEKKNEALLRSAIYTES